MLSVDLDKTYPDFRVSAAFTVAGGVTGLVGPSGAGKSTVLHCIAGLLTPNRGRVAIGPLTVFDAAARIDLTPPRRRVGFVPQEPLLFEHLTVRQNLLYGAPSGDQAHLDEIVDVLQLNDCLDRSAAAISGGQKQRVALGRALLARPVCLLLDEPLTGLDRRLRLRTLVYIRAVLQRVQVPTVYVSHSLTDVLYLCDQVVLLDKGAVRATGPADACLAAADWLDPRHSRAVRNIVDGTVTAVDPAEDQVRVDVSGRSLCVIGQLPASAIGQPITLSAAARDILLARGRPTGLSARNILPARVVRCVAVGAHMLVRVHAGTDWLVEITRAAADELALAPGVEVHLVIKAATLQLVG